MTKYTHHKVERVSKVGEVHPCHGSVTPHQNILLEVDVEEGGRELNNSVYSQTHSVIHLQAVFYMGSTVNE